MLQIQNGRVLTMAGKTFEKGQVLIENGKITTPIEQITIAGNFYNLLSDVKEIGNDLKFNSSAIGSPSLEFDSIQVAGL